MVGGGPAGAATAIALAQLGHRPLVLEAAAGPSWKVGECLPPSAAPVLDRLGLTRRLPDAGLPSYGNRSVWGATDAVERDFLFGTHGVGWRLDRARFEQELAATASEAGVDWRWGSRLVGCSRSRSQGWDLRVVGDDGPTVHRADVVVDASGRAARVARLLGVRRVRYDHLVGALIYARTRDVSEVRDPVAGVDSSTLVEAVSDGWWYSLSLPGDRLVVGFMTDADLLASTGARRPDGLRALLEEAPVTRKRVLAAGVDLSREQVVLRPAHTARLTSVAGPDWLAVGDAAIAFDPLASYGIAAALGEGYHAAESIAARLAGRADALSDHARLVDRTLARYLIMCRDRYACERRWPEAEFWRRRSVRSGPAQRAV